MHCPCAWPPPPLLPPNAAKLQTSQSYIYILTSLLRSLSCSTVSLLAYVVLAVATLALLAFGYALSLIWVALVEWSLRLLGLAAFGPHMYYVGQYVESLEQDERDKARAYEAASSAERQAIRGALTAELLEERRKRLQEELARHITQVNKTPKHGLLVQPRPNAGREKFLHHPIVSRSRASPLPPAIVLE